MTNTFYVAAQVSADGNFADCTYYADQAGTEPIEGSTLHIPRDAGSCTFAQADNTTLLLIGATFKTIGSAPGMNGSNFAPATDENIVTFAMPTNGSIITKGVVLLFSTPGQVENLYPSSDPQVLNDGPLTC